MCEQRYGRIVTISSVAGKEGNPNASAYSAAKAGVIALTKSLGKELAGENIAVNCITPAAAKTRILDQMSQQHIDWMLSKIPRGRFLEIDELASLATWLGIGRELVLHWCGIRYQWGTVYVLSRCQLPTSNLPSPKESRATSKAQLCVAYYPVLGSFLGVGSWKLGVDERT